MARLQFIPIYAGRSDGETEIRSKKYGREFNGPSNDQLDRVANPDDFYEPLDHDHAITIEWKRQLGGMLQRDMRMQGEFPWFLMFFPENYRLYNHIKGGKDSSGAYLYGFPQGRKKRFRSALEFYPHFQWLMEGKTEDPGDCACKNCAGDWVDKIEPLPGRGGFVPLAGGGGFNSKKEAPAVKKLDIQAHVGNRESSMTQSTKGPGSLSSTLSTGAAVIPKPGSKVSTLPNSAARSDTGKSQSATHVAKSRPLPTPISAEQEQDQQYGIYTYRIGELVWFNRGPAWGLSLVIKRDRTEPMEEQSGSQPQCRYLVQPLSHPYNHPPPKLVEVDEELRPWLAWSAPNPTHKALIDKSFATADWQAVLAGRLGSGDAEVDGSILAAKQVDESLALLSPLSNNTTTTGERRYNCLFLGGEKIFLGDPIRLRTSQGHEVVIVHDIIEKLKPNSTNIKLASVNIIGDIYRFTTVPCANTSTLPSQISITPHIPPRMLYDLDFRNSITIPTKGMRSCWSQVASSARLSISNLKGRWYESSILLPILRGEDLFASDLQNGDITDVGDWINGRGDASGAAGKPGVRYRTRLEALGQAIPSHVQLEGS